MNKRRHPRLRAGNVAAHLKVENRTTLSNVEDISESGLFVRTNEALPVGMSVSVALARPGLKKVLLLTGKVARRSVDGKKGIGIAFESLDADTKTRLAHLIGELGGAKPLEPAGDRFAPIELPLETAEVGSREDGEFSWPPRDAEPEPPRAPAATPPPDQAKLFIQIKGLIMELGTRDQALREKDEVIARLERELAAAREEIEALKASAAPAASEPLRREAKEALAHVQALAKLLGQG